MRELDDILSGFIEADYSIRCLLQVMAALEEHYNDKADREQKNTLFAIKKTLTTIERELEETTERLDKYILNEDKSKQD